MWGMVIGAGIMLVGIIFGYALALAKKDEDR